ncbi:MAG: hypothetical protein ACE5GM_03940 [bacterium]
MAEINLTQTEADQLVAMEKHRADDSSYDFSNQTALSIPLVSANKREHFLLDLGRGRVKISKIKYQNRTRQTVILVRLELNGAPHRNPDGEEVPCPHLHLYREGFGDKWAYPLPADGFTNPTDTWKTLNDFMKYCNIVRPPSMKTGLF